MSNTATVITTKAGEALIAQMQAENKVLVIDKFIFANVPNRPAFPNRDDVVPTEHVVHESAVHEQGRLTENSVIYSTTLASNVGPFSFNWSGLFCSEHNVLVAINFPPPVDKTVDAPGITGNTLVRSFVLEYKGIAETTNITVDPSSWQYDAHKRMSKMDNDTAQAIIDQNGKDWFIDDGFIVTPQSSAYCIKAGAGYVSGHRISLDFDRIIQVPEKPAFIYVDAFREGSPTGEWQTKFTFVVAADEKDDYTDAQGVNHFVCKIAQVFEDGSVSMLRKKDKVGHYVDSINNLHTTRDAIEWRPNLKVKTKDALQLFSHTDEHGVKSYYLPNVDELPFVTSATWVEDAALGLFEIESILTAETPFFANTATSARSLAERFADQLNVLDFGVVASEDVDVTDALNTSFELGRKNNRTIIVPSGTYRVDDTVILRAGGRVIFSPNATLQRFKKYSDKTTPVFSLNGNFTESTSGRFISENASPNGVIVLGHNDINNRINALWWKCMHPFVQGTPEVDSIGIHIPSAQAYEGINYANYFGYVENPIIRNVNEGIVMAEIANAHTIIAPQFYMCTEAALSFYGAYGNTILGGFVHTCPDGVIGINMRDRRTGKDHNSQNNFISGLNIEAGGSRSRSLYIDNGCTGNIVKGIGNMAGGSTVLNKNNEWDMWYTSGIATKWYNGLALDSDDYILNSERVVTLNKAGMESQSIDFFRITPQFRKGCTLDIDVIPNMKSLERGGTSRYVVSSFKSSVGADFEILSELVSTRHGAILEVRREGDDIIVGAKLYNNGTGTKGDVTLRVKVLTQETVRDTIEPLTLKRELENKDVVLQFIK